MKMSNIDEATDLKSNKINNSEHMGGIKSLIQHSNVLGNVILATENKSFEPLPFSNYSMFDESYGIYFY